MTARAWLAGWLLLCAGLGPAWAQGEPAEPGDPNVDELLERIQALEAKVEQLEDAPGGESSEQAEEPPEWRFEPPAPEWRFEPPPAETKQAEGLALDLPFSMRLRFWGKVRVRAEYRDPASYRLPGTFGRPANDDITDADDFALLRTRLTFDLRVLKPLRALIQLQDSRTFGDIETGSDRAELHLRQAFIEVQKPGGLPLWALVGRWRVPNLGDERLVSQLDFNNVARSWDGAEVVYAPKGFWFKSFVANVREGRVFSATGDENDDFLLGGFYGSLRMIEDHEFDAYFFWRHLSDRVFASERGSRLGDRKDYTLGVRIKGEAGPLGYTGELAWQLGDQAGDRIRAWAGAVQAWVGLDLGEDVTLTFRGEYSYASGDRDPDDGKRQTFDPLASSAHRHNGHQDLFSWQNLHQGLVGVKLEPLKALSLHADFHVFWLDKRKDAWYAINKRPVRRDTSGAAQDYVGSELDLYVKYVLWERIWMWAGYSHFWPGNYVRDTGKNTDQDWVFLQAELRF